MGILARPVSLAIAYAFDPGVIGANATALAHGVRLTVEVSAIGMAGALLLGLGGAIACELRLPVVRAAALAFVEAIRNTPLLVQIFFLYFALPDVGVKLSTFTVAWLALMLWGGAYNIENFRAGFEAVERGHREAGRALGLTAHDTLRAVIVPLGFRTALPSVTNTLISVLKQSAFMVAIGFPELTDTAVDIIAVTFRVFEIFITIAFVYLILVWAFSTLAHGVERRLRLRSAI